MGRRAVAFTEDSVSRAIRAVKKKCGVALSHLDFEQLRASRSDGFIYFITSSQEGFLKIGWASNPDRRLETLQTGNHNRLSFLFYVRAPAYLERIAQKIFKSERIINEWFNYTDELDHFVEWLELSCGYHEGAPHLGYEQIVEIVENWAADDALYRFVAAQGIPVFKTREEAAEWMGAQ